MMKVLLAEDDTILQRLLQILLQGWGYEVVIAPNGRAAWEEFQQNPYSLILTDWMMPEMDGPDLIRCIRADERPGYVYILLLTAKSQKDDLIQGMEAGADDFLTKPFDRDELRVRIRAGERVIRLEQKLAQQNVELEHARDDLEQRVLDRTADLDRSNKALQEEMAERIRNARELAHAQAQLIEKERERKDFYRDVIRYVTQNKFHLTDLPDVPQEGETLFDIPLNGMDAYREIRKQLRGVLVESGMNEESVGDFILAVGEAVTNAMKHAEGGQCVVRHTEDRIVVRISDNGHGIPPKDLAATILKPGFSTAISMGMGYTIIMQTVDKIWLVTDSSGTVVQLEKWIHPEEKPDFFYAETLDRF